MRKFLTDLLKKIAAKLEKEEPQTEIYEQAELEESAQTPNIKEENKYEKTHTPLKKIHEKRPKKQKAEVTTYKENPARDLMEMMEVPFLALSKKRKNPIFYESQDKRIKVKVTRHTGHFLASIYDWDIILFVASKMQEIINSASDIPPRTMVIPRYEILKSLHKFDGSKQLKDLERSLERLQLTGIDTTIRNEDYRYRAGFGFLDSWGYTERKDIKEIRITLSQWLYDGICAKGALLKVDPAYFNLTSALKKFLYRTARKHVGNSTEPWEFSIEKLYEKSGSEREFKKFKSDLKVAVMADDIPGYTMRWIQKNKKCSVIFSLSTLEKIEQTLKKTKSPLENACSKTEGRTLRTLDQTITDLNNPVHKIH